MFHPEKNAYLQLVCPMEPRLINKAVQNAMKKKYLTLPESNIGFIHDIKLPPARKLESEQPSLSMPCVDVTVARLGFERIGLQIIIRELNSQNKLIKLQAIHTLMDQTKIPESVFYLLKRHVVYRLIDLMLDNDPIVREKVSTILTRLANYHEGRKLIISRPIVVDHLIGMFMQDRKQIRYAASLCLKTLTRHRWVCAIIVENDKIIESLLKMIKHDYMEIVLYHMNSLKNLSEWDPVVPLKANAFQVMRNLLIYYTHYRVVQAAMDCLTQLCKHSVGKELADKHDINDILTRFLVSPEIEVIVSTLNLMQYTTTTERSLWRMKQYTFDLVKRLVALAVSQSIPLLQARAMQVLINLCECSDIRIELKTHWEGVFTNIRIRPHESFFDTSETTTFGLALGYNYQTMCLEDVETIKSDYGDTVQPDDVYSYISRIIDLKKNLIKAINTRKDKN